MHLLTCLNNITAYPETEQILQNKGLIVKKNDELGLFIVKYNKEKCDMSDSDVQKCRGLIMEIGTNKVVCIPPFKSLGLSQFSNVIPNLSETIYEEFIDGTMINLFNYNGKWIISTRSNIGANCRWFSNKTFEELFNDSTSNLNYDKLDPTISYTFVLQHPDNRIVKNYTNPEYTLVVARKINQDTNEYIDLNLLELQTHLQSLGVEVNIPRRYKFDDFMLAMDYVNNQKYDFQGLIMKYNGFRSKIRNTKYNHVKNLKGNTRNMKYTYLSLRQNNGLKSFLEFFPEYEQEFLEYRNQFHGMTNDFWNCYKTYYISPSKISLNKKTMPFQFRPLCYELHGRYLSRKHENYKITWTEIKNYINCLPPAKQLFIMNYHE